MKSEIIRILVWFQQNNSLILTFATIALVLITFFYLVETKSIRKVAQKALQVDSSPKVFLGNITSEPRLNYAKKEIEVKAILQIKNVGKTEAKNFEGIYTLSSGKMKIEGKIGPIPYLFTNQGVHYETKMLGVSLNEKNFEIVKEATETKKSLIIPEDFGEPIFLDLDLKYVDQEGKEQHLPYKCKYTFHTNAWIFITE